MHSWLRQWFIVIATLNIHHLLLIRGCPSLSAFQIPATLLSALRSVMFLQTNMQMATIILGFFMAYGIKTYFHAQSSYPFVYSAFIYFFFLTILG